MFYFSILLGSQKTLKWQAHETKYTIETILYENVRKLLRHWTILTDSDNGVSTLSYEDSFMGRPKVPEKM